MSGSAGGNRIKRQLVKKTVEAYVEMVIGKYPQYKGYSLTGSFENKSKKDFGDIDLIITVSGTDKKEIKEDLMKFFASFSDSIIVPFKSVKYSGKKSLSSGELVTVLFPVLGTQDFVQIDNIISTSEQETEFKRSFLNLPAEVQGLLIGLARVFLLEHDFNQTVSKLGIGGLSIPTEGQEYEFVLSSKGLSLRKVELGSNFKEKSREDVWISTDWKLVEKMFDSYSIYGGFETLLDEIARTVTSERARTRLKGFFTSMVTVKSGETGTEKGERKTQAITKVGKVFESKGSTVAIYGGGFKPPHLAHFTNARILGTLAEKLIIFVGPVVREGEIEITPEMSKQIWEIYCKYIPVPCEIYLSKETPILDTYKWVEAFGGQYSKIITGAMEGELKRFKAFLTKKDKYPNVDIYQLPRIESNQAVKVSAVDIRSSKDVLLGEEWIPEELTKEDKQRVINIIMKKQEDDLTITLSECFDQIEQDIIRTVEEGSSGTAIAPTSAVRSEDRANLEHLFYRLRKELGPDEYTVTFNSDHIRIELRQEGQRVGFDYTPYMASILREMKEEGLVIEPLPEIYFKEGTGLVENVFTPTGSYNPESKEVYLYAEGRHPKDVLRSFAHEMIHHKQNLEGKFTGQIYTTNINEDAELQSLEEEAYKMGNIVFRKWEDKEKSKNQDGTGNKTSS